ncbi:hypothetical protein [Ancrocorticia sp.]
MPPHNAANSGNGAYGPENPQYTGQPYQPYPPQPWQGMQPPPPRRKSRKKAIVVTLLALIVAAAVAALIWWLLGNRDSPGTSAQSTPSDSFANGTHEQWAITVDATEHDALLHLRYLHGPRAGGPVQPGPSAGDYLGYFRSGTETTVDW